MSRQVKFTLDDETVALIESVPVDERDRFINTAIRQRDPIWPREDLRQRLEEGAIARAERDRDLAEDWVSLEEEACQTRRD